MEIEVRWFRTHGPMVTSRLTVPIAADNYITGYEVRIDGQPLIHAPFYHHGVGYHTICFRQVHRLPRWKYKLITKHGTKPITF